MNNKETKSKLKSFYLTCITTNALHVLLPNMLPLEEVMYMILLAYSLQCL